MALNRDNGTYDTLLELRDITDGAETTTTAETGIAFACRKIGGYKAVFNISALDTTNTDETYVLSIGISDVVGGTYTTIGSIASATVLANFAAGNGRLEIPLSGNLAREFDTDAEFIQCVATLGGTTPSITYGCHLEQIQAA
jgi:hypothetical protein